MVDGVVIGRDSRDLISDQFELLRAIVEGTARTTGEDYFQTLVRSLAQTLRVRIAFVATMIERREQVQTLAMWDTDRIVDNIEYPLAGTPCEVVVNGATCHHPDHAAQRYPLDLFLAENGIDSYLGVPLRDRNGDVMGHLAVMDQKPLPVDERCGWMFRVFADRATAELERVLIDRALHKSEQQFRDLFDEAPIAYVYEDIETRFLSANGAAMRLLGLKPEDVPGTYGMSLVAPTQTAQERVHDAFSDLRQGKERGFIELELRRKDDGRPVWVQFWSRPEADGRHTRTMIVDITDRVLAEREKARLTQQNRYLQEEIKAQHNFDEIIGTAPTLNRVLRQVAQVAPTDSTVLITGETGTGKELFARAIHSRSARKDRPLIKLNCAALPAGLVESELFGHEKGAFTGAHERRVGRFALAHGGTIFLDEIGDMPLETQAKLLRVLQEHEFEPVGATKSMHVDVRVVAATNRDLAQAVADGKFRADLYYRLNVFPVPIPPLRERTGDVPLLAEYFLMKYAAKIGRHFEEIEPDSLNLLAAYHWPGNVRELENVIERAVILSPGPALLIDRETLRLSPAVPAIDPVERPPDPTSGRGTTLAEMERRQIIATLEQTNWVIEGEKGAARILGLHPNTLRSRLKKLGIERS